MSGAQEPRELLVVRTKLRQHVFRGYEVFVVVLQTLMPRYVADGADCDSADLARPFRDIVRHSKDLVGVFVEQQMIVAKMTPAHVPVKILRLQIEREDLCK